MESKDEMTKRSKKSLVSLTDLTLAGAEMIPPLAFKNVCVFAVDNL